MRRFLVLLASAVFSLACSHLGAAPIFTIGAGSAVTSPDRIATFDTVTDGTPLAAYTEGGLSITVPNGAYNGFTPAPGFSGGFHYPNGGVSAPTTITPVDSAIMYGVEFNAGTGFSDQMGASAYYAWETQMGGVSTGGGYFTLDLSQAQVVGFSDPAGFDTLLVANYASLAEAMGGITATGFQALALDNLSVQTGPGSAIPEPATIALSGLGILALGLLRRRR